MDGYSIAGNLDRQPDLLARLQNVVRQLNRHDIRTVSALIAKAVGDQNAGLMAVRLLHWFPKSKKAGGWVYKSWRDWNAECNLSQAQVKRVHSNGFLEMIGIEHTIMKANGTPTVHYRLDEKRLIQRLAEYLDIMFLNIQDWMCLEQTNEYGQDHTLNEDKSDQLNQRNEPDEDVENEPIYSAESAKSITDSDLQTRQQNNHQDIQHNSYSVAVVNYEKEKKKEILQSLGKLGIGYFKATQLLEQYAYDQVDKVLIHAKNSKCTNPAGYVIRALKENWTFYSVSEKEDYAYGEGELISPVNTWLLYSIS